MGATQSLDFDMDCQKPISNMCLAKASKTPEQPREMLKKNRSFKKEIGKIDSRLAMLRTELESINNKIEKNEAKISKAILPSDQKIIDTTLKQNCVLLDRQNSLIFEIKELELAQSRLRRTSEDLREEMSKYGACNVRFSD